MAPGPKFSMNAADHPSRFVVWKGALTDSDYAALFSDHSSSVSQATTDSSSQHQPASKNMASKSSLRGETKARGKSLELEFDDEKNCYNLKRKLSADLDRVAKKLKKPSTELSSFLRDPDIVSKVESFLSSWPNVVDLINSKLENVLSEVTNGDNYMNFITEIMTMVDDKCIQQELKHLSECLPLIIEYKYNEKAVEDVKKMYARQGMVAKIAQNGDQTTTLELDDPSKSIQTIGMEKVIEMLEAKQGVVIHQLEKYTSSLQAVFGNAD